MDPVSSADLHSAPGLAARNLLAGTMSKYVLLGTNIVAGVVMMPFIVHRLGPAEYGLWMMVASLTYYFSLLDLGYGSSVVRHLVDADARGDVAGVNRVVSTFFCIYGAIGAAAFAATAVLVVFVVPRLPHLSPADVRTGRAILAILGARIAIAFPMTVFGAVTNARQGFVYNNAIAIVMVLLNAVATYVVLILGGKVVTLVFTTTTISLLGYVGYAWTARHVFPGLDIRVRLFNRRDWREATSFSLFFFVIDLASQLSFNLDNVIVGAYLGTTAVAVYVVAVRLSEYQRRLCDQFSGMLYPVAVGFGSTGNQNALRRALIEGARIATILVAGVTMVLVGYVRPLVLAWMGPAFEASVVPFYVLGAIGVMIVGNAAQSSVLLATDGHRLVAGIWIAEAVANVALSVVLVRRYGATGVALGTAIPMMIGHVFVMTPAACARVGLSIREYLKTTLVPAAAGVLPAAVVCATLRWAAPPSTLPAVVSEGAVTAIVYAVAVVGLGLDADVRRRYVAHIAGGALAIARLLRPNVVSWPVRVRVAADD